MAPIAIAIPPRLMMFELMPSHDIGTNASATATGSDSTGTSVLRRWNRNRKMTTLTTTISSNSVWRSVAIARWMRSERS